jgi:hypothetical protein
MSFRPYFDAWQEVTALCISEFDLRWLASLDTTVILACFHWPVSEGAFRHVANDNACHPPSSAS